MASIFELITNDNFFRPLASKNKEVYFECIIKIIEKSKEGVVLYENDAKDTLTLYLNNCKLEYYEDEDNEGAIVSKSSADIIRYFRSCGWLTERELSGNGEYITSVTSTCRRVIDFFISLTQKNDDGAISNHILAMYDIISSVFNDDIRKERPYSNILNPLLKEMDGLKLELIDLTENISNIMSLAMGIDNMNSLGCFMLKDEILEKFFNDYFYVKNNGTIPTIINKIKNGLRKLNKKEWIEKMSEQYAIVKDCCESQANEYIVKELGELQDFLEYQYQEHMNRIEAKIDSYYVLAHSKMILFSKNGMNIEAALDKLLLKMKNLEKEKIGNIIDVLNYGLQVNTQKYIGVKSFANRKRNIKDDSTSAISPHCLTSEEILALTNELLKNKNRFSLKEVKNYLYEKMRFVDTLELKDVLVETRYDALMYVSAISYAHADDFNYEVEILDEIIDFDFAYISNIRLKKGS